MLEKTVAQAKEDSPSRSRSRKKFLKDFTTFVEDRIAKDKELKIRLDANNVDPGSSDIKAFITSNDLVEVFSHLRQDVTPPNTYKHSNNHLCYILITPALISALKSTGFLLFNIPFLADYGSMYTDLHEEMLCLGEFKNPVDRASRDLVA
eukprot:1624495-Ditylum_brightwellii.AAC.1